VSVLYSHLSNLPQVRHHRCRNPHCGAKLEEPTPNARDAFCCKGCESGFYAVRCRVCETLFTRKTKRRIVCWRSTCRYQFQRHPEQFFGASYPSSPIAHNGEKTSTKSKLKIAAFSGRPFRVVAGPEPPEINLRSTEMIPASRANLVFEKYWQEANHLAESRALIKRETPPINIIGGHKFSNAPTIDLSPTVATPIAPAKPEIGDDLSIPAFLRRDLPTKSEDSDAA
jgi:hypothetical protein